MPVYVYEHVRRACARGKRFEVRQGISEPALAACPRCAGEVRRAVVPVFVCTPRTDSDLKSLGFTKLVRRDKGVYENVTAGPGESRIWDSGRPGSAPDARRGGRG